MDIQCGVGVVWMWGVGVVWMCCSVWLCSQPLLPHQVSNDPPSGATNTTVGAVLTSLLDRGASTQQTIPVSFEAWSIMIFRYRGPLLTPPSCPSLPMVHPSPHFPSLLSLPSHLSLPSPLSPLSLYINGSSPPPTSFTP